MDMMTMLVIGLLVVGGAAFFVMKQKKDKKAVSETPAPVLTPAPAPAPIPVAPAPVAPAPAAGVVIRNGARFAPSAPLAEDWLPSMAAVAMYGTYMPSGPVCEEDRIARPPGARSPKGYPMWDGNVMFNGHGWGSDAEVAKYIAASIERDTALAEWERQFLSVRYVGTSGLEAAALDQPSRAYLWEMAHSFHGDLWRVVLSGGNRDMNRVINDGCYIGGPTSPVPPQLATAVEAALAAQARGEAPVYRTE